MTGAAETGPMSGAIQYTPTVGTPAAVAFGAVDANGTAWIIGDVQGMDGPPTAGQVVQRQGDHGGLPTPQFLAPRPITVVVTAVATSRALREAAAAALQAAVPVSELALWRLDETIPKQLMVRRSGPLAEKVLSPLASEFTIGLIAPDPRKYGTTQHVTTVNWAGVAGGVAPPLTPPFTLPAAPPQMVVTVTNAGSFETRPTITIAGPVTGPGITNLTTGQRLSWPTLTLGAGDYLVVDLLAQAGYYNGSYRPADLGGSAWFSCPPGATTIQMTGTAASGANMTVAWRDAWS